MPDSPVGLSVRRDGSSAWIRVGPWLGRFSWGNGQFPNGSRWFSGWHRWADPATWGETPSRGRSMGSTHEETE